VGLAVDHAYSEPIRTRSRFVQRLVRRRHQHPPHTHSRTHAHARVRESRAGTMISRCSEDVLGSATTLVTDTSGLAMPSRSCRPGLLTRTRTTAHA
jgi:hypothetical protein